MMVVLPLTSFKCCQLLNPMAPLEVYFWIALLFIPEEPATFVNPPPEDISSCHEGFLLLGFPIGSPSFCRSSLQLPIDKSRWRLKLLPHLHDSQSRFALLRSCLSASKLSSCLRTCPLEIISEAMNHFDTMADYLFDIVGSPLSE